MHHDDADDRGRQGVGAARGDGAQQVHRRMPSLPQEGPRQAAHGEEHEDLLRAEGAGRRGVPVCRACYWGYLYLQDGDMVNFDGLHRRDDEANFAITMDSEGYITTSSHLKDAPQVTSMHWDNTKDVITADVNYKGQTFKLTFKRVNLNEEQTLKDFYDILAEEGIVGGYADLDTQLNTDVSDNDATGPSYVRRL